MSAQHYSAPLEAGDLLLPNPHMHASDLHMCVHASVCMSFMFFHTNGIILNILFYKLFICLKVYLKHLFMSAQIALLNSF